MMAAALVWDHLAPEGSAMRDPIAPAAIRTARIAPWVAGRRTAIRAVSQPAISAKIAPQTIVTAMNQTGAAWCGGCPET